MAFPFYFLRRIYTPYYGNIRPNREETEMDELKLNLSTRIMRTIVTKILAKAIYKKTGYDVNIQINELKADACDGKVRVHIDADVEMNGEDLMNALKSGGLL